MSEEAYDRPHSHYASDSYHRRWWASAPPKSTQAFLQCLQSGMNVLDCWCGPGSITVGFAQIVALGRVVGVDLNEDDVRRVEELARIVDPPNAAFRSADIYALPFAGGSFDVVFAHGAMEHLAELDTAIRKMVRVLKSGGLIGARTTDCGGHIYLPQDSLIDGPLKLIEQIVKRNGENQNIGRHMKGFV